MSDDESLSAFLQEFGFTEDELFRVTDVLNAFRTIPGTTLSEYLNRILETVIDEERAAFLKGVMVGVAIRNAVDALDQPDMTAEERKIEDEIEKLGFLK